MAKYRISAPDGSTYEVTAPDEASQDDVLAYAQAHFGQQQPAVQPQAAQPPAQPEQPQPAMNGPSTVQAPEGGPRRITAVPQPGQPFDWSQVPGRLENVARGVAKGATFGQSNRIAAALGAATGIGGKFGDYSGNLQAQDAQDAAINADTTGPNGARAFKYGQTTGVIGSPINKLVPAAVNKVLPLTDAAGKAVPWMTRYGNMALQGGILNTLYQAGMGDKEKAKQSAEASAGLGAVGMVAPEGGGAAEAALTAAKNFGKGALTAVAPMAAIEGGGAVLHAVLSPILSRLAPDEQALARIAEAAEQDGLEPEQLLSKLEKRGGQGMLADVSPGLTKLAEDTAQFPGDARTMAQRELGARAGSRLATDGGAVGRVEQAIQDNLSSKTAAATAQTLLEQRAAEGETEFGRLFAEPTVPDSKELNTLASNARVTRAMKAGIADAVLRANAEGTPLKESSFFVNGKPTAQAWHLAKSELDSTAYNVAAGKQLLPEGESADTGALKAASDSIRKQLKALVPGYEETVDKWAGKTQALDALQLGVKAARGDARITSNLVGDMSDSEREFFRIGLADQLQYLVSKTPDGANVAKRIFGDQNARRNIAQAFDSRSAFNEFRKTIAQETNFYNTATQVLRGSQTASREAGMAEQAKEIGAATLEGAKEGGVQGGLISGGKAAAKGIMAAVTQPEAMRSQLGRALFTRDPQKQREVIERIKAMQARGAIFGKVGAQYAPASSVLMSKVPMSFGQ